MGWIGIAGGNAVNVKRKPKQPYTPEQYDAVLKFFQENAGNFYTVNEVDEGAEVGSTVATQAIIDVQVADFKTGVRQDPKSGKYGIPKKGKK
jgi:cytochrome c556